MTPGGIVMTWKSNEARAKRQKSSENVRQSFMFHYPFLGHYFIVLAAGNAAKRSNSPQNAAQCSGPAKVQRNAAKCRESQRFAAGNRSANFFSQYPSPEGSATSFKVRTKSWFSAIKLGSRSQKRSPGRVIGRARQGLTTRRGVQEGWKANHERLQSCRG